MTPEQIKDTLALHAKWLRGESGGARAHLRGAYLSGANLGDADLCSADLYGANLSGAVLGARSIVPESGGFTGWKKLRDGVVAQLRISAKAERVSALTSRKCRASKVRVVALYNHDGSARTEPGKGAYSGLGYPVGGVVVPDSFDPDNRVECSHGIHFFITRKEAEKYQA
ncbi:MAG TPA: DUF5758 domain-containing protein [Gemmatimonadales bacterium]|nr:DUF5758 domain-containing protein [Gemmatimonadales bacterium]